MAKAKTSDKVQVTSSKTKAISAKVKKSVDKKVKQSKETSDGIDQKNSDITTQASSKEEVDNSKQAVEEKEIQPTETAQLAKAGKRSAKALKEAEEKRAKEERLAKSSDLSAEASAQVEAKNKQKPRTAEDRLKRRGKNYRKAIEQIDKTKQYNVKDAVKLAMESSKVKFDATVELHVRLSVDPKQADQNVRDIVVLPAGTGKSVRIAVFGNPDDVASAKKAGADIAAADEFLQQLDKGELNFDVLIAAPSMMPKLGKYARVLGPKGLMPNPKSGTVTTDIAKAVGEAKAGRVEYRVDSTGIVHVGIGKVGFGADKLFDNAKAILASIKTNKPSSVKSTYILSAYATTTMGPSVQLDLSDINSL